MRAETVSQLLDINRLFYQQFGHAFAATRQRLQPGVTALLARLPLAGRWLDLGCGSGELARELHRRGFTGSYVGLDFSRELIEEAEGGAGLERPTPNPSLTGGEQEISWFLPRFAGQKPLLDFLPSRREGPGVGEPAQYAFRLSDLSSPTWSTPFPPASFDTLLAFASLHHLPGTDLRRSVLRQARRLLVPGGQFIHSEWQFQHSQRLLERVQPWERIGLSPADLDPGDYLLDWRYALSGQAERVGLRYVHLYNLEELAQLAQECGFDIRETFESDGQGGRLGLYQVWQAI